MRAAIHRTFGAPEEVLAIDEIDWPEPGPEEVRVRIVLAAIHNHDLMTVRGQYGVLPDLPARAGTEAMGLIDAVGADVGDRQVGQRVTASGHGVWAEEVVLPARATVPVDDEIPDEVAAQMFAMPMSALTLLDDLSLEAGEWMVQNAANGAVGRLVASLAPSRGTRVINLVRRAEAVDELAAAGIHDVVATDDHDWRERVAALLDGASPRAGVDSVGGSAAGDVLSLLGEGGELVVFGAMASPRLDLAVGDVLFRRTRVRGFWGARPRVTPARRGELAAELRARLADGTINLPVSSVHALDDITDAVRASGEAGRVGKVLLRP